MRKRTIFLLPFFWLSCQIGRAVESRDNLPQTQLHLITRMDDVNQKLNENSDEAQQLVATALAMGEKLRLTNAQKDSLWQAYLVIEELKQSFIKKQDSSTIDSIRDLDHRTTLHILSSFQFRQIVKECYTAIDEDLAKIWSKLESANMVSDLDEERAKLSIRSYLIKLRVARETYWNDEEKRATALHQIKVYAPQVVKRYFSTNPKRKNNNKEQFKNYLW